MAVAIKLSRFGKKHEPHYRIVAMEKKKKRGGAYLEVIGIYDPLKKEKNVKIDKEKLNKWLKRGAVPSEGVRKILKTQLKQII